MTKTDQSECRVVLGVAHLYAGDISDVVRVLSEEKNIPPIFQEVAYYTRGVANLCLGQYRAGLSDINRCLVANPQSYKVINTLYIITTVHTGTHILPCPSPSDSPRP